MLTTPLVLTAVLVYTVAVQSRQAWHPTMMLDEHSTPEDVAKYNCSMAKWRKCSTCLPCTERHRKCLALKNTAANCIDIDTVTQPQTVEEGAEDPSCIEDEMLEDIQIEKLQAQLSTICSHRRRRTKRKIKTFADFPVTKWETKMYYKIDGLLGMHEIPMIREAVKMWEKGTCLEYEEVPVERKMTQPHLLFSKVGGWGCYSYIGKTTVIPQPIYLSVACFSTTGYIAHEIGHSLGLFHEHQRLDRDAYIEIMSDNVREGREGNFAMILARFIEDKNVSYDLGSAMHYRAMAFSSNGRYTIRTRDPRFQRTIGQREELSFADLKIINLAYCTDKCKSQSLPRACMNDGYQDPKACDRCRCPDGLSGRFCENAVANGQCGGRREARPNSRTTVSSPGYNRGYYDIGTHCSWLITAPEGYQVSMKFTGNFGVFCFSNRCRHWVEVRTNGQLGRTGPRFCCRSRPTEVTVSEGREMLIIFKSIAKTNVKFNKKGFQFEYTAVKKPCPDNPCRNDGFCWQKNDYEQRCECKTEFSGPYCETRRVRLQEPRQRPPPRPQPTTTSTTKAPSGAAQRPQVRSDASDLVFLLDRSPHGNRKPWTDFKYFVREILNGVALRDGRDRVGVVTFDNNANATVLLGSHSNNDGVMDALDRVPLGAWQANVYRALRVMQSNVLNARGNRADVADVAVIITDSNFPTDFPHGTIVEEVQAVRAAGVHVIAVGVGNAVSRRSTLQVLAGDPDNVFQLDYNDLRNSAMVAHNIKLRMRFLVRYQHYISSSQQTAAPATRRPTRRTPTTRPTTTTTTPRSTTTTRTTTTTPRRTTETTTRTTARITTTTTRRPAKSTSISYRPREPTRCRWVNESCTHPCGGCGTRTVRYVCPDGSRYREIKRRKEPCNIKKCQAWCLMYIARVYYRPCGPECCDGYKPSGENCIPDPDADTRSRRP